MFCPKLKMWYIEAHKEKNSKVNIKQKTLSYAIYPKSFYDVVKKYTSTNNKIYDFCFIGGLKTDELTLLNRNWIMQFIAEKFNDKSYLQFTDATTKMNYNSCGNFDYTLLQSGFVPKETPIKDRNFFDENYFLKMCKSKFCLCPAGDVSWSMRFYEALMCKTIPIVINVTETYRSEEESKLDYKFYLATEQEFIYREDWVEHNYNLFLKYHTLEFSG
jgi:hypothetical protein